MITIGGALTSIGLIGYIIKNRKSNKLGIDLFMITILASLVFEIGYFAKINNTIIEYNYMFSIISFLGLIITYIQKRTSDSALCYRGTNKIKRKNQFAVFGYCKGH